MGCFEFLPIMNKTAMNILCFSGGTVVKNVPANAGDARDTGSVLELGWSGEGNGNPLQCFCLENSLDWRATVRGVAKSRTWLSDYAHVLEHICTYLCVDIFSPRGYILGVELSHYMVIFSLWLTMLNIILCAYWPLVYLLFWCVCLIFCPFFELSSC